MEREFETTNIEKTDQELVSLAISDKSAFSEIVKRYEAPLRRYIRYLGFRENDDVDDILQEIFIKIFINLNDYDQSLKFSSWIYRIGHNEAISFFRKKKIRSNVLSNEEAEEFFDNLADDTDFLEMAHIRHDVDILKSALSDLDQKYKDVIVLRFLEGKSYTEISDILKIPEGTVATMINRGKKELKKLLETKGIK